jgi:hypothetical protein
MTTETQQPDPLENLVVLLRYTLKDVNELINMMNHPLGVPVMAWANYINDMHLQIEPQVNSMNERNKDE